MLSQHETQRNNRGNTHPLANPARWSRSFFHFFAGCECGCNSAENQRRYCPQEDLPHLQKGLWMPLSAIGPDAGSIRRQDKMGGDLTKGIEVLHAHAMERNV